MGLKSINDFALWHCFCVAMLIVVCDSATVVRNTSYGRVRGKIEETALPGYRVESFLGIPFAKPPVGQLRFEPPKPPEGWHPRIRDALTFSSYCTQSHGDRHYILDISPTRGATLSSSEDCLYLNIYTPVTTTVGLLPVMVYVHGGSNAVGTGAMRDGSILAAFGDIVVVTLNYRLAELGFLGLGEEGFPGNYGLLDQISALKWVQQNIRNFNGDSNKVTAVGHSAGANDVGLHLVSPFGKGLFRYAILMSGSPMMPYASTKLEKRLHTRIRENLSTLGCNFKDAQRVKNCLKKITVDAFLTAANFPCALYSGIANTSYISDTGQVLLQSAPINAQAVMVGITKDEVNDFIHSVSFKEVVKELEFCGVPRYKSLHYVIQHEYITEEGHKGKIFSDYLMNSPVRKFADTLVRRHVPVYTYQYNYASIHQEGVSSSVHRAVPHGLDVMYVFGEPLQDPAQARQTFTENDKNMSRVMMHLWSSFVKFGRPTLKGGINNVSIVLESDASLAFDLQNSSFLTLGGLNTPTVKLSRPFLINGKTDFWNKVVPSLIHYIDSGVLPSDIVEDLGREYFICRIVAGVFITATFVLIIILMMLICLIRPNRANV